MPAGLRLVRAIDRAVLDVARDTDLRPMELYTLILLDRVQAMSTAELAESLAASSSQAKQLALRLAARGIVRRSPVTGRTELTPLGHTLANGAAHRVEQKTRARLAQIDDDTRIAGGSSLSMLMLPG
jgi:DNA-binding MarR family transcriptional regulator